MHRVMKLQPIAVLVFLATVTACAPVASQAVPVAPEAPAAAMVVPELGESPESPGSALERAEREVVPTPFPEEEPAAPAPHEYIVHVAAEAVENGNAEFYVQDLTECFQRYHGLADVKVVFDLDRDLKPDELTAFELEGFEQLDTGCAENLFTMLEPDGEYEE